MVGAATLIRFGHFGCCLLLVALELSGGDMTLCVRAPTLSPTPSSLSFSSTKHLFNLKRSLSFKLLYSSSFSPKVVMSSSNLTIEHVVLFKVKDDTDPLKVNAMVSGLNSLASLDQVLHISAGPILRTRSSSLSFTHILHSRYNSKDDLSAYSLHPNHLSVVRESVLPICDDIMAVDWVAQDLHGPVKLPPGSALRVTFLKLKAEKLDDDGVKSEILEVINGIKEEGSGQISQINCGENFSPARAKGYSIATLAVFPGLGEIEAADSNQELVNLQKEKVRKYLESVVVVDYVLPLPQSASL